MILLLPSLVARELPPTVSQEPKFPPVEGALEIVASESALRFRDAPALFVTAPSARVAAPGVPVIEEAVPAVRAVEATISAWVPPTRFSVPPPRVRIVLS